MQRFINAVAPTGKEKFQWLLWRTIKFAMSARARNFRLAIELIGFNVAMGWEIITTKDRNKLSSNVSSSKILWQKCRLGLSLPGIWKCHIKGGWPGDGRSRNNSPVTIPGRWMRQKIQQNKRTLADAKPEILQLVCPDGWKEQSMHINGRNNLSNGK